MEGPALVRRNLRIFSFIGRISGHSGGFHFGLGLLTSREEVGPNRLTSHLNIFALGRLLALVLDRVTASDPRVTDYILESPARCPNSRRGIFEKTLIEKGLTCARPKVLTPLNN